MSGFADLIQRPEENNNDKESTEPWIKIQQSTFTNWVNDKLRTLDLTLQDARTEFSDGVKLCRLIEVLMGKSIGRVKQKANLNHYEASGNLALALNAMRDDGVRLVNIGAEDISGGNLKLILGMIWTLIRHYQIGSQTKIPPKKLMLAWINAVLHPRLEIGNFSSDWNDGIALHGLVEFCRPGTFPDWHALNKSDKVGNCESSMTAANEMLGIPLVVSPENMASRNLDELSGMTYLSYFMAVDAPGYKATLDWTKQQITPTPVNNFDTDWNNGYVLSALVQSMGGSVPGWPDIDTTDWTQANQRAMVASENDLGIKPILAAKDLINPEVDHIGVMAYAAWHMHVQTATPQVAPPPIDVVDAPPPHPPSTPSPKIQTPPPEAVPLPAPSANVHIVENIQIHTTTTITVSTENMGTGVLNAKAMSPSEEVIDLLVATVVDGTHNVAFTPEVKGMWDVEIRFDDTPVTGSPFAVNAFDASQGVITRENNIAFIHEPYVFQVDVSDVGYNDVTVYVLHDGEAVDKEMVPSGSDRRRVSFVPLELGEYTVAVYCGGNELPGSPFDVTSREKEDNANEGVYATGQGVRWGIQGKRLLFDVDASSQKYTDKLLTVNVTSPSLQDVQEQISILDQGKFRVAYVPQETGDHTVTILYDELPIPNSPYTVNIRKAHVFVRDLDQTAFVGHNSQFTVDASECGRGTIEIDSDLPIRNTEKVGEKVYSVTFVPKKAGRHDLSIKFGPEVVEGSPFAIEVHREEEMY